MEDGHQFLHQEDTIIEGAIIKLFEEALGLRVSPNYGGRCGTTEERLLPFGGMRSTQSSSMWYTNREDTRKSHPFHYDVQLVHLLHHHTLRGVPMDVS
jgi:hypothetical protein